MRVALASSLHLDHGSMPPDPECGQMLPMQCFVPMGLLSLKACADRDLGASVDIAVRELNTLIAAGAIGNDDAFYDTIAAMLVAAGGDFIGLMTDADSLHHSTLIAERVRARAPDAIICAGGPTTSPIARRFLERFGTFDLVVRGEGELTFSEMLATLKADGDLGKVAGLTWRRGSEIVHNAERPLIQDLDDLPIPDFDCYPETGSAALYLDVGRGCPFKCRFCSTAPFWDRRFRMKSSARIIAEMRLLRDQWGRDHVNFSHDIFTANQRWTAEFCDAVKAADLGMTWSCSSRTDTISPELLERMADAGCDEIYYGIESGSPAIQERIDKNLDLKQSRQIVAATRAAGIRPVTGLIIGYPFETEATLSDTLDTFFDFLQVGGYRAHLFTLCPFPEAPMFAEHADAIGRSAEYHDLPLAPGAFKRAGALLDDHRDIFSSVFRFATPAVAEGLVDAAEEISAHLVVLRRLWPLVLRHYPSPLDWYRRWVDWITAENRRRRPGAKLAHHGDARDLLRFLEGEIARLGLEDSVLASVVRYETIKHAAAEHLAPGARVSNGSAVTAASSVVRACDYLAAPFRHDLRFILNGGEAANDQPQLSEPIWILFAKTHDGALSTMHSPPLARRLLELADRPRRLNDLIDDALLRRLPAGDPVRRDCLRLVQNLVDCKLLSKVDLQ